MTTNNKNILLDEHHALLFDIRRSLRYHNRRRRFFDRLGKFSDVLAAVCGSSTVATFLGGLQTVAMGMAVATAITSALNLVFGFKENARQHHDFARDFINLDKELNAGVLTESLLREVRNRRLDIEAEEPPVLRILDLECHNELIRAEGYGEDNLFQISFFQKARAHFVDWGADSISRSVSKQS